MTSVFVGIIVVIGLFYLLIVIYQRYILKNSNQVVKNFDNIKAIPIKEEIENVAKITLTGEALELFNDYKKQYNDIQSQNFEEIKAQLKLIQRDSRSLNVFKTQKSNQNFDNMVAATGAQIKTIQAGLVQLKDTDKQHETALTELKERYKKMRKTLLVKNYQYGPAGKLLDDELSKNEKMFQQFSKLTKEGDQIAAEGILQELKAKTANLGQLIDQIPPLYKEFTIDFKNQVQEVQRGHTQMLATGYNFPEDSFDENISYINKQTKKSLALLKELDLDKARNGHHQINMMIERLYDEMERELNAKKQVEKNLKVVAAYIHHAQQQNKALSEELALLNQNYDLNHHEIEDTRQLKEQIKTIYEINARDVASIDANDAVFSIIKSHQDKAKHDLSQIEAQQRDINDSIADLNKEEDEARATIQDYDLKLHGMNRQIENLNLPGIPGNYLDAYDRVDNEIAELFQTMNKEKISMDDINKQLEIVQHDIDNLSAKTKVLVDSAVLAEEVLQYSNRYRSQPQIESAITKATHLFGESYNYEESLSVISAALNQAEPGAVERITGNYRAMNDNESI